MEKIISFKDNFNELKEKSANDFFKFYIEESTGYYSEGATKTKEKYETLEKISSNLFSVLIEKGILGNKELNKIFNTKGLKIK